MSNDEISKTIIDNLIKENRNYMEQSIFHYHVTSKIPIENLLPCKRCKKEESCKKITYIRYCEFEAK